MTSDYVVAVLGRGLVAPTEPVLRADDFGLSRGDGCFETARVVTADDGTSRIDNLDAHLARLQRSLDALDISADVPACAELVHTVVNAWNRPGEAAMKLMVTRGVEGADVPTVIATVHPVGESSLRQRLDGVAVVTLSRGHAANTHGGAPWMLGGVKSLSYALNMAAMREAARRGADDVIWTSTDGLVLEAPTSTVVWRAGDSLLTTPAGASGILAGTTMAALFAGARADGWRTDVAALAMSDVATVDGLWLASSVRGVAEVISVDGVVRARDAALTDRLRGYAGF